jgi:hypothetical protein
MRAAIRIMWNAAANRRRSEAPPPVRPQKNYGLVKKNGLNLLGSGVICVGRFTVHGLVWPICVFG